MISWSSDGDFTKTEKWLRDLQKFDIKKYLESAGKKGVFALIAVTPKDSGIAANSWTYEIEVSRVSSTIWWKNTDLENGFPVALMLQYGHGTGTGGWVQGKDYINPAMRPVFDELSNAVWKAVTAI
jgi:hypothetical protein